MTRHHQSPSKYERSGLLAVDPSAFYELFLSGDHAPANVDCTTHTEVFIRGPLEAEPGWCWDSYPEIETRVRAACERTAPAVLLRIDSPGGDVTGCFELARNISAMCKAAGKTLYAYVDGHACSAAYAIACVADGGIYACETAVLGSIGVICSRWDYSEQNAAHGVRVAFITSGARKADGHPDNPMTPAELTAQQRLIDATAGVFFKLVAEHRGIDAKTLDAGVFIAGDALTLKLADKVTPLAALIEQLTTGMTMADPTDEDPKAAAREALKKLADDGDENAAAALAALDGPGDEDEDEDAAASEPEPDAPKDDDKATAASAMRIAREALAELHKLKAQTAAEKQANERATLIASRPDLSPALVATLATAPLAVVRDLVKTLPRVAAEPAAGAAAALAASQAQGTIGVGVDPTSRPSMLPPDERHALDLAMGLIKPTTAVVHTPYKLTLGETNLRPVPANTGVTNG